MNDKPTTTQTVDRGTSSLGSAAMWSYVMDGSRVFSTLVVTLILAKELSLDDFGIGGWSLVFVFLVRLVVQNGMVAAIIQRDHLEHRHMNAGFWMVLVAGTVLTALTVAVAPFISRIPPDTDAELLSQVLRATSLIIVFGVLGVLPEALARRQMKFRPLAMRTTVASLIGSIVAIVMAFSGAGVWAIVAQQLTIEFVALVLLWVITPWKPSFSFDRSAAADIGPFWAMTSLGSLGGFLRWRADTLLIGLFFNSAVTGLYRFAARFPETWSEVSIRAIQSIALPELSKHQADPQKFAERVVFLVRLSAIVSIPALGILAGLSDPLIDFIDADKWGDANLGVKLIAAATAVKALTFFSAPALQAIGRTGVLALLTWFHAAVSVIAFSGIGILLSDESQLTQVNGSAWSRLAVLALAAMVDVVVIAHVTGIGRARIVGAVAPSFAAAGLVFGATTGAVWLTNGLPTLLSGAIGGGVGAVVLAVAIWLLEPEVRVLARRVPVIGPRLR